MQIYRYKAINAQGAITKGVMAATTSDQVAAQCAQQQWALVTCGVQKPRVVRLGLLMEFVIQLSALMDHFVGLDQALGVLVKQSGSKKLSQFSQNILAFVRGGHGLSASLRLCGVGDEFMLATIKAGETGGHLAQALADLAVFFEQRQKFYRLITGAVAYPFFLLVAALISIVGMGIYVIPVFEDLLLRDGVVVSALTKAMFAFSHFLLDDGLGVLLFLCTGFLILKILVRTHLFFRYQWQKILLNLPVVGVFLGYLDVYRFLSVLSGLLAQKVAFKKSFEVAVQGFRFLPLRDKFSDALDEICGGARVDQSLQQTGWVPGMVISYFTIAGETGQMARMVMQAREKLQRDLHHQIQITAQMAGPVLIMIMGGLIALVVMAMLMGVYGVVDTI